MSGMSLLDRHVTLFRGSLRTLLQRESDRRRCAGSCYEWLFQPYMGEELVALACQTTNEGGQPVVSVAAVVLSQRHVQISRAWVATIANVNSDNQAAVRRHQYLYGTEAVLGISSESLGTLAEFIGNRPLVVWQLDHTLEPLNNLFKNQLGFGLPNAQVDIAKLHQRQLRRLHPQVDISVHLSEALSCWRLPTNRWPGVLSKATDSALLYIRLKREAASAA